MIKRKFLLPAFSPAAGAIASPGAWISSPRASWSLARIMSCTNPTRKCLLKRNENFHSQENLYTYVYASLFLNPQTGYPKYSSTSEWKPMWYIHTMYWYSTYSKKKKGTNSRCMQQQKKESHMYFAKSNKPIPKGYMVPFILEKAKWAENRLLDAQSHWWMEGGDWLQGGPGNVWGWHSHSKGWLWW